MKKIFFFYFFILFSFKQKINCYFNFKNNLNKFYNNNRILLKVTYVIVSWSLSYYIFKFLKEHKTHKIENRSFEFLNFDIIKKITPQEKEKYKILFNNFWIDKKEDLSKIDKNSDILYFKKIFPLWKNYRNNADNKANQEKSTYINNIFLKYEYFLKEIAPDFSENFPENENFKLKLENFINLQNPQNENFINLQNPQNENYKNLFKNIDEEKKIKLIFEKFINSKKDFPKKNYFENINSWKNFKEKELLSQK